MITIEVHNESASTVIPIDGGSVTTRAYKYFACIDGEKLQWIVYDGKAVGDKFVIDGEVLSLAEIRERGVKPTYGLFND